MNTLNIAYKRDLQLLLWCMKSRDYQGVIYTVRLLSRSGDGYLQVLLPCVYLLFGGSDARDFLLLTLIAFAIERSLYLLLKNSLKRRRPPEIIPNFSSLVTPSDHFSFPSGHTMAAFMLATLCTLHFGSWAYLLYLWASAVGASRVILGVHFPTDIIAGAFLGVIISHGVYLI